MSKSIQGDEWKHRLSSFFYQKGKLQASELTQLKPNVYIVETTNGEKFIVKGHRKKDNIEQQWKFFEKWKGKTIVPFIRFPNGKKVIFGYRYYWCMSLFIKGRKLNYKHSVDRLEAVETLKSFHQEASNIYISNPVERDLLFNRWYRRLLTFEKTKDIFLFYGYRELYRDLTNTTLQQLRSLSVYPWERNEQDAKQGGQWIHGDVASHNFVKTKKRGVYLIDFDLLQSTNQLYDFIQLGQRFLPYIDWNLEHLLDYQMVHHSQTASWLSAIVIPSDILREWLYFSRETTSSFRIENYLLKMSENWKNRKELIRNVQKMIRTL